MTLARGAEVGVENWRATSPTAPRVRLRLATGLSFRTLTSVRAREGRPVSRRAIAGDVSQRAKKCGDRAVRKDMFATGNRAPQGTRRAEASGARAHLLWQTLPSTLSELRAGDATRACARAEVSPFLLFARLRLRNDAFSPELGPLAFRSVGQPEKTRPSAGTSTRIGTYRSRQI